MSKNKNTWSQKMFRTINTELTKRNWGIRAKGKSLGGAPRYYIIDYRGFALASGIIRYYYYKNDQNKNDQNKNDQNTMIFYRGQRQDWELRPSLYRGCKVKEDIEKVTKWHQNALSIISKYFDKSGDPEDREALAQHYGLRTRFIDIVDNIGTALWFAYDECQKEARQNESVGYIQIIAAPKEGIEIIDLRRKPSEWLRPHIQQALCLRATSPEKDLGKLSKLVVATFVVPCTNLRIWSNYDNIPRDYFYPNSELDQGAVYWEKAREALINEKLLNKEGKPIDEKGELLYP